jgi:hypothetical protein
MTDESLVTIYESDGMLEAEVVKAKLEANGIPVLLKYDAAGQIFGMTAVPLGRVEVQVPAALEEDALDVLAPEDGDVAAEETAADDAEK